MLGSTLSPTYIKLISSSQKLYEIGSINILVLRMRKLRMSDQPRVTELITLPHLISQLSKELCYFLLKEGIDINIIIS